MTTPPADPPTGQGQPPSGGYYPPGPSMGQPPGSGPYAPESPVKQKNILGRIAIITAVVGFIFACIPGALIIGFILLPIAFILGVVGLFQSGKANGTSIAAVIVAIVGTIVGAFVFLTVVSDAFEEAFSGSDLSATESGASSDTGSRGNPLAIGQSVANEDWEIALGDPREAGAEVAAENPFNDSPQAGMEYWIVPITATYTGEGTGLPWLELTVKFVGEDNKSYDGSCGVISDNISDIDELYTGGTAEGNTCVAVPAGADGLWSVSAGFGGNSSFFTAD